MWLKNSSQFSACKKFENVKTENTPGDWVKAQKILAP